jgi:hypothetical protein
MFLVAVAAACAVWAVLFVAAVACSVPSLTPK